MAPLTCRTRTVTTVPGNLGQESRKDLEAPLPSAGCSLQPTQTGTETGHTGSCTARPRGARGLCRLQSQAGLHVARGFCAESCLTQVPEQRARSPGGLRWGLCRSPVPTAQRPRCPEGFVQPLAGRQDDMFPRAGRVRGQTQEDGNHASPLLL